MQYFFVVNIVSIEHRLLTRSSVVSELEQEAARKNETTGDIHGGTYGAFGITAD